MFTTCTIYSLFRLSQQIEVKCKKSIHISTESILKIENKTNERVGEEGIKNDEKLGH